MSLQSGFVFPSKDFKLIFMETIGYISDNVLYRVNLVNNSTQIVHHPKGKSYQALTTNHKRGVVILADYSQNPTLYFQYLHQKQLSFEMRNFCMLQIQTLQISLDCKYLLVACGVPDYHILLIDVEKKMVVEGKNSKIQLQRNGQMPIKIEFNPANSKLFCIMYPYEIVFYQVENVFEISDEGNVKEAVIFHESNSFQAPESTTFQTFIWDQLNNVYLSNGRHIIVYSTDTIQQVIAYQIQNQQSGSNQQMVVSMLLTPKHLIVLYRNGRIEWLNKFYPDLLEDQEPSERPFFLDKYYEVKNNIKFAVYDHKFQKILVALEKGFFMILDQMAQTRQTEEQEEDKNEKAQKDKNNINRQLQIEPRVIGPYHYSSVILIKEISDAAVYVTVSTTGRIIFWSLTQKKPISYFDSNVQVVSADLNIFDNVLALGSKNGILQFYSVAKNDNVHLFKEFRLTRGTPIDQVIFSTNSEQLAVLSKEEKRVYYILTHLSMPFEVLGYTTLQHEPKHISWNPAPKIKEKPKFQYLLVCIGYGVLMINSPAATSAKRKGKQLSLQLQKYALRTDLEQQIIGVLPSGEIITTGADKFLKKYKQPEQLQKKVDFKSRIPIAAPVQQIQAHDLETLKMVFGKKGFVSGGQDGTIQFRSYAKFNEVKQIQAHGCYNPSISAIGISQFNSIYYSCGKDGSVYVWTADSISIGASDSYEKQAVKFTKIQPGGSSLKYYQQLAQQQYLQKMKDIINKKKKAQFQKIDKIKKQLKQLLAQNQKHDELQRLQRDQFAIDLESRDRQSKAGEQLCEKIKQQSKKTILYREAYTKKLKQITWDRMKIHLKAINGLKSNYLVYNYQIRKRSQDQLRKVKLILELRKSQLKQFKKKKSNVIDPDFHKNKNVVNGGVPTPLIFNSSEKKVDKKQQKAKKKKQQQVQVQKQPTQEIMSSQQWILLYSAFETFSINSKKNQIVMMKNLIIKIKEIFNAEFNKLLQYRQNQNQMINDKNKRIIEICDELKRPHEIIVSNKNILQNPETILDVKPEDIPFKRYLSRDERQKLQKQRLKEEQRLRLLAQDDSSQRALQKMMGGTLEEKKTSVLEVTVDRQKWMDKPLQQMTEEQKMKLKQFQVKKQKAEQEKERIIKKLQAELRKLKQEIEDIMDKYDQKLFTLLKRRIQYDYRIQQQELYCAKLALSIVNSQQSSKKAEQLNKQIKAHESKLTNMQAQITQLAGHEEQFVKARDAKKANLDMRRLGQLENKIRPIQKTVFEDIGTNIKKRRQMEEKIKERDSTAQYQLLNLDPMHQIQFKNLSSQKSKEFNFFIPEIKTAQQHYEIPQNTLMQILQTRFQTKKQEVQLQKKVKILKDSLVKIQKQYQVEKIKHQSQKIEVDNISHFIQQLKSDLQVQIRINQGQVEINNTTPVPQLDDALLISRSEIDAKNQDIMLNAEEKIGVMQAIKQSKIAVTKETLNLQRKQQLIAKLSSLIKQIQMLKVKKEMQVALAKKDTKNNENELKSLKTRIQDLRKEGDKRISIFQKKIQQLQKQIQGIHKQNKQLQVQRYNLENTVKQREKIKDMMCGENGEGNQQAAEKFEQIAINRKLFDKAKQQTEEIQLLRQQLSKLKAKTFANFSNVNR